MRLPKEKSFDFACPLLAVARIMFACCLSGVARIARSSCPDPSQVGGKHIRHRRHVSPNEGIQTLSCLGYRSPISVPQ